MTREAGRRPGDGAAREAGTMARFGLVGAINTGVDVAVFAALHGLAGMALVPANLIAFAVALAGSFVMNRYWAFRAPLSRPGATGVLRFVLANLGGAAVGTGLLAALVAAGVPVAWAKLLSIGGSAVWNYVAMRVFVFGKPEER